MQEYKSISSELWSAFKKYVTKLPQTDKEWDACLDEFDAIAKKYTAHHEYASEYATVCCNELERLWKKQYGSK